MRDLTDKSHHIHRPRGSEGSYHGLGREVGILVNGRGISGYKGEKGQTRMVETVTPQWECTTLPKLHP